MHERQALPVLLQEDWARLATTDLSEYRIIFKRERIAPAGLSTRLAGKNTSHAALRLQGEG